MYNGHKNRNAWNVALWIGNDEALYSTAIRCIRTSRTLTRATERLMQSLDGAYTPDGVPYTKTNVRLALSGLR